MHPFTTLFKNRSTDVISTTGVTHWWFTCSRPEHALLEKTFPFKESRLLSITGSSLVAKNTSGWTVHFSDLEKHDWGFPGGLVVKNPPPKAGDMVGSLVCEDPICVGAANTVRCNYWAWEPQALKPPQWEALKPQPESSPCSLQLEKSPRSNGDPAKLK